MDSETPQSPNSSLQETPLADSSAEDICKSDQLNSEDETSKFSMDEKFPEYKGWESVGFHRPLANELWEVMLELINESFSIFIIAYLIPLLYPYPEIMGYRGLANGILVVVYTIFDTGTNFGLGRFISEYRIKNPRKMMEYVSFTIRYQMITGLIQISILSWYLFEVLVYSNYGYLLWILLLGLQKQYPGMLGVFKSVLNGMQHYNITQVINWVQGRAIEMVFNVGFILWGRAYGESHPEVGIIMGMAIFGVIGNYIDDVIMMFVSGFYVNKILKKNVGFSLMDSLTYKIGDDVKRNAVKYGVPGSILPIISASVNTYILFIYSDNIGGYITWVALVAIGFQFSGIINQFGDFGTTTNVAEAYMNKKKNLAEFYVSYSVKWRFFFRFLIAMTIIAVIPYFYLMIDVNPALAWYEPAFYFLLPAFIKRLINPLFEVADSIMIGAKAINQYNTIRVIEEGLKILFVYLFIFVWEVQNLWGRISIIILMVYQNYIPYLIKSLMCYIYINKKILKIRIYWVTSVVVPFFASLPVLGFAQLWLITFFPPMMAAVGFNVAVALSFPILFLALIFSYFPLSVLLGGWDEYQIHTFEQAVKISGPSKILFVPVLKIIKKCAKLASKIGVHGKFSIPYKQAHIEIVELMELKRETEIGNTNK
jgi:hypothetical protein